MSKTSQWLRLKDNHPTMIKLMKLYDLAEELGITISFHGQSATVEDTDRDPKLPFLRLEDIEDNHWVSEWPPATEFKVIYQNPKYLEELEKEAEDKRKKAAEENRLKAEAAALKEKELLEKKKQADERAAQEKEAQERKLLAELKLKYEG